jgi:hypothetical protein
MVGRRLAVAAAAAWLWGAAACGSSAAGPAHDGAAEAPAADASGGAPAPTADGTAGASGADGDEAAPPPPPDAALDLTRPEAVTFDGRLGDAQTTCNTLDNTAPTITYALRGTATPPPVLAAGVIADGRYELVAVDIFSDVRVRAAIPTYFQRTIEVSGGGTAVQLVELARDNPNETGWSTVRRGYTWGTAGSRLIATPDQCAVDAGFGVATYLYEASADAIVVYYPNTRELFSYLRAR